MYFLLTSLLGGKMHRPLHCTVGDEKREAQYPWRAFFYIWLVLLELVCGWGNGQ
jgi:hypothetical protein